MNLDVPLDKIKKYIPFPKKKKYNSLKRNQKLIISLRQNKKPRAGQLKHVLKILSMGEKRLIFSFLLIIIICLGVIVFTFVKNHLVPVPSDTGEYAEGIVGFPRLINPLYLQTNDADSDISELVFSGLMRYDKDLKLVGDLAYEHSISEDQKTYSFKLRDDAYFHNGNKLTADDVVFTIETLKDPLYKSPLYSTFKSVIIKKIDEHTVEFSLPEPYSPFINVLTFGILPQAVWMEVSPQNAALAQYNIKPIGTGPYKFSSFTKDKLGNIKTYTLERNDSFYGTLPHIKTVTFKFYPDFNSAYFALKGKEIQSVNFLPKNFREELSENKNIDIKSLNLPQYTAIFFNQSHSKILKDKKMRMALVFGLNKEGILEKELNKEGIVIESHILPGFIGYNPDLKKYEYTPQEANKLLDEAGWEKIISDDFMKSEKEKLEKEIEAENEKIQKLEEKEEDEDDDEDDEEDDDNEKSAAIIEKSRKKIEEANIKIASLSKYGMQTFLRKKEGNLLALSFTTVNSDDSLKAANAVINYWNDIGG